MGYYIRTNTSNFRIRKDNLSKFWEIVTHLMSDEQLAKNGNVIFPDQPMKKMYYSWIDTHMARKAIQNQDIFRFFFEWRYELMNDEENEDFICSHIMIEGGESKIGDEELLFEAIAPIVENGSYIEVIGEDGERFRWSWNNGKLYVADAEVVFSDPVEYRRS